MYKRSYGVSVRVKGRTLKEFPHNNEIWIEGRKGSEFTLKLQNDSNRRALFVLSIDGLDITTGEEATKDAGGYVLSPNQTLDIPGWRLNNDEIAHFRFHKAARSYAAKTDRPRNIGVIGAAIFMEKEPENPKIQIQQLWRPTTPKGHSKGTGGQGVSKYNCSTSGSSQTEGGSNESYDGYESYACSAHQEIPKSPDVRYRAEPSLGTEFGKKSTHRVRTTTFERASSIPTETLTIRYADRKELKDRGIDLDPRPITAYGEPNPFPKDQGCKPPEGWRG